MKIKFFQKMNEKRFEKTAVLLEGSLQQIASLYGCEVKSFEYKPNHDYYYQLHWRGNLIWSEAATRLTTYGVCRRLEKLLENSLLPL